MSLSRSQKALVYTGIAAGIYAIGKNVYDKVQDISKNLKFFFAGFSLEGFPKDANGKILWNTLRTSTAIGFYNQSMVSLNISDIWLSVEYYDKASKQWFPFAASAKIKDRLSIPGKQTTTERFVLDVSLTELVFSQFWKVIAEPVKFRVVTVLTVLGTRQRAEQVYTVTLPANFIAYFKAFLAARKAGTNGINGNAPKWVHDIWAGQNVQSTNSHVIGYTALTKRKLKPGHEYSPLIDGTKTPNNRVIVDPNASVEKTVQILDSIATDTKYQTQKLANHLYRTNIKEFGRNIWQFLYDHIQYKLDIDGEEELREPARAWKDRATGIDCDCYALFVSTILKNKNIPHYFRVVKMYGKSTYQHIYVIVPHSASWTFSDQTSYTVIDPVMEYFGSDPDNVTGILDIKAKN